MKLVVAITGSSSNHLGIKFVNNLPSYVQPFVIFSKSSKKTLKLEKQNHKIKNKKAIIYKNSDLSAPISSGSFGVDAFSCVPCSINSLANFANGISDSLIKRAFCVAMKEQKKILLSPREMPFSAIALSHMKKLSKLGVIIAPPVIAHYANIKSIDELEDFFIGKWQDALGIENNLYKRWGSE